MSQAEQIQDILKTLYHPELKEIDMSLGRIETFLADFENPHRKLPPVIHIAGTNGKGSVLAYLKAIYEAAGMRVHRYTSPHLVRFNERIEVAGKPLDDEALLYYLKRVKRKSAEIPVTFFEATTVAAMLAFAENPGDVVLLETGMGGRLDATNVIEKPELTAITPISYDHRVFLGETLTDIAFEKAGIIKPGVPCVSAPQEDEAEAVLKYEASSRGSTLFRYGRDWKLEYHGNDLHYESNRRVLPINISLKGEHQYVNAGMAVACVENATSLPVETRAISDGLARAEWPARLQQLHGGLISFLPHGSELWLDGGHNPAAADMLARWAGTQTDMPLVVIAGMMSDKDAKGFFAPLMPHMQKLITITVPGEERSYSATALASAALGVGMEEVYTAETLDRALSRATEHQPVRVLICGSIYLAGKVLSLMQLG